MVMFKKNIGKQLLMQAEKLGACERGIDSLDKLNEQELVNRYIHFIDFAIDKQWPTNDFIKKHFDRELLHRNNIYIDEMVSRRNARQVVVVQGKCSGSLLYDGLTTADIYVMHDSELTIDCSRLSKVFINVYDRAKVKVYQRDAASVYVYKHGDGCEVVTDGEVLIRKYCEKDV